MTNEETKKAVDDVKPPWISDGVYDFLRYMVEFFLPAVAIAYAGGAALWDWGYVTQVVGSIGVLGVFIGSVIKINQKRAREVVIAEKFDQGMAAAEADYEAKVAEAKKQELHETRIVGDLVLGTGDEELGLVTLALEKPLAEFEGRDEVSLRIKHINMPEERVRPDPHGVG